jgi:hypothetical protein
MPANRKTNTRRKPPVSKYRVRYQNTLHDLHQAHFEAMNNLEMLQQAVKAATDKENILMKLSVDDLRTMKGVVDKLLPIVRQAMSELKEVGDTLKSPPTYVHKDDQFQLDFTAWAGTQMQKLAGMTTGIIGDGLSMLPEIYSILDTLVSTQKATDVAPQQEGSAE